MNTEFYKQLVAIKREKELTTRGLAKLVGLSHGTLIEFFNENRPFRPLRDETMYKLHNTLGISFEVMDAYNKSVKGLK